MLVRLYSFHKISGLHKRLMGSRIQPGKALSHQYYIQLSVLEIDPVQIRNLQLASGRRLQVLCILHHPVVIKIKAGYAVIGLRLLRFLFNRDSLARLIEFHDAKPLRIVNIISEHSRSILLGGRGAEPFPESLSLENVVSQNHSHGIVSNKLFSYNKGLGQTVRTWLYRIA